MKDKHIKRYSVDEIRAARPGKTDWARVDALTDAEIDKSIAGDPDWAGLEDIDWSKAVLVTPVKKRAISIRVEEDVLAFFKRGGAGYQGRMNSVLRHFVAEQNRKKEKA